MHPLFISASHLNKINVKNTSRQALIGPLWLMSHLGDVTTAPPLSHLCGSAYALCANTRNVVDGNFTLASPNLTFICSGSSEGRGVLKSRLR